MLKSEVVDWGPQPFKILNFWFHHKSFQWVIQESWLNNIIRSWGGGVVLKEKIKGVKAKLKIWNKEQFGDTHQKIATIEKELNRLESEGDDRQLSYQELLVRKKLQEEL